MRCLNYILCCLLFAITSCRAQGLILLTPYESSKQVDSSRVYKQLGIFFSSDTLSISVGFITDKKVFLKLPRKYFFEVYKDSFLVASINPKVQQESSRPVWTMPRSEMYIIDIHEKSGKVFYCKPDSITIRDNLKVVDHINRQYKIDYDLISINLFAKEILLQRITDKTIKKISLVELPIGQ